MRTFLPLISALCVVMLGACTKADEPAVLELSMSELALNVGSTATITVTASSPISLQVNTEIATAELNGTTITVTGIAEGTTELWVTAGHLHATCVITVTKASPPDDGDDDPSPLPIDDSSDVRIVGTKYVAGATGILSSRTAMNYAVTHLFADLADGSSIALRYVPMNGLLSEAVLIINGSEQPATATIEAKGERLMRVTAETPYLRLTFVIPRD